MPRARASSPRAWFTQVNQITRRVHDRGHMGDRYRFSHKLSQGSGSASVGVREYELVVDGELSDDAAPAFEGMRLERRDGTTILVGRMRDQAKLQGS